MEPDTSTLTEDLLTYADAAEALRAPQSYVELLVTRRQLAHIRLGRYVRIRRSDLDTFVAQSRIPADREAGL